MGDVTVVQERMRRAVFDAGLEVFDPTIEESVARVPEGMEPVEAIYSYNTRGTTEKKVDCALCGHRKNHWKGFRVKLEDGSEALIGIECGERLFGKGEWDLLLREHKRRVRNVIRMKTAGALLDELEMAAMVLGRERDQVKVFDRFWGELSRSLPFLVQALAAEARAGNFLTYEVSQEVVRVDKAGKERRVRENVRSSLGTIPGVVWIRAGCPRLSGLLTRERVEVELAVKKVRENFDKPEVLVEANRTRQECRRRLKDVGEMLRGAKEMADVVSLAMLEKWLQKRDLSRHRIKVKGGVLVVQDDRVAVERIEVSVFGSWSGREVDGLLKGDLFREG